MDATAAALSPPAPPAGAVAANSLSFQGLAQLKAAAQADPRSPQAIRAVAQQFEALLLQQMLGAMDATQLGPDLLGDSSGPMFKSLFNQQLASSISQGQGIGLASFIARELSSRYGQSAPATAASSGAASGAAAAQSLAAYRSHAVPTPAVPAPTVPPSAAPPPAQTTAAAPSPPAAAEDAGGTLAQARRFIAGILPSVQAAARQLGVTPVAILAQAALETGWGRHTPGNNLFGVKSGAGWSGDSVQAVTQEVRNGVTTLGAAAFRAYQSAAQSVQNYAALLSGPRYASARGQGNDVWAFAGALQRSGYATDPDYAAKLVAVAHSPRMRQVLAELGVDSSFPSR